MPKLENSYTVKKGDKVYIKTVESEFYMKHLIGKVFEVVDVRDSSYSRPIRIIGQSSEGDDTTRTWLFSYDEVIPASDAKTCFEYRKKILDEKLKNIQKEILQYESDLKEHLKSEKESKESTGT